ncbi:MAG: tryptophan 7-halogenase [Hyphomonadaceae bacterium]|nr:tryptophan 7-halogenase [Hyphomonadaceae bacterium]
MEDFRVKEVVIVGGGTAGWITAAVLSSFLSGSLRIRLIESEQIGTVGVGEATIPQIQRLNALLGINEAGFMRATRGSFKLGIEFNNWGHVDESYLHTFGRTGVNLGHTGFHHYWIRAKSGGHKSEFRDYSLHDRSAYAHRFRHLPRVGKTGLSGLDYAYHFDAGRYALFLRRHAESQGVRRVEGRVVDVALDSGTGFISSVQMDGGESYEGDLFVDCTGFRGLLIGQALGVKYHDWSRWLPCNRAVAVSCEKEGPLLPYTKSTAHTAGWQWRIPLQHRTGNGHVFCDDHMSVDEATRILLDNLDGKPHSDPGVLKFTTGRRDVFWHKNCVAVGLASGFLEPLESTSIHLIQSNVSRLMELFPTRHMPRHSIDEYNKRTTREFDCIRDFLVLHYHRTDRTDSEFWTRCRTMKVPDTLTHKMNLFTETGIVYKDHEDLFSESSWVQVMLGQGLRPKAWHSMADRISDLQLSEFLNNVKTIIAKTVDKIPSHEDFVKNYCASDLQ